jgi:hypothetical protein
MPNPPYSKMKKPTVVQTVSDSKINTEIVIQSLIEAHLTYTGRSSGKQYEWLKAGDTVAVLEEDTPELLEKRLGGNPCCGNPVGNKIFDIYNSGG